MSVLDSDDVTDTDLLQQAVHAYLVGQGFAKAAKCLRKQLKLDKKTPPLRTHRLCLCPSLAEAALPSSSLATGKIKDRTEVEEEKIKEEKRPFQRVDPTKVEFLDERCRDNSYASIKHRNQYGQRAHDKLAPTKGADFRKQKNKQKKGTYRGGAIDTASVNSIKFQYSDDDQDE